MLHDGNSVDVFLNINSKTGKVTAHREKNTPPTTHTAASGLLSKVDFVWKPANTEHDIPAMYVYHWYIKYDDVEYRLETGYGYQASTEIIQRLLNAPLKKDMPIHIAPWLNKKGDRDKLYVFVRPDKDADRYEWAYTWDEDDSCLKDDMGNKVPKPIETGKINKDTGNEILDWTPVNEFWANQFKEIIYPAINGSPFVEKRSPKKVKDIILLSNKKFPKLDAADKMIKVWDSMAGYIKKNLPHPEDQAAIISIWQAKYVEMGGDGQLMIDGTVGDKQASPEPDTQNNEGNTNEEEQLDDLPF